MIAIVALAAIACSDSSSAAQSSSARLSSSGAGSANSKAADLRARLDLLLGEHVFVIAKASLAATSNRADEYRGYATLLTVNGGDLSAVIGSAFGASSAATFDQVWAEQNNDFVDYTVGVASHDASRSSAAASGLVSAFVPHFVQFMSSMARIPTDLMTELATEQVVETKAIIDDQAALNNAKMFMDLHQAYAQVSRIGDALASAIARKFQDKFPGNPANRAADFRVSLDNLLQENSYLATMATSATAAGRSTEQAAALSAMSANAAALVSVFSQLFGAAVGTRFGQVWGARDADLVVYASNAPAASRQGALSSLTINFVAQFSGLVHDTTDLGPDQIANPVSAQVADTVRVIDDQRTNAAGAVGADDHTAAAATSPVADLIATATVAKLPGKFSG